MAFDESINVNSPDGSADPPSLGDNKMRSFQEGFRARSDVDGYWPGNDPTAGLVDNVDTGEHRKVTLRERSDPGAVDANKLIVYSKEVGGHTTLMAMDEDQYAKQITVQSGSALCLYLEGKDLTASAANVVDDDTIEVSGGKLQLKAGTAGTGIESSHLDTTAKAFCDDETIEIDAVDGLRVKTGALGQAGQAEGTTDISEATGAWVDMTNMSVSLTTTGGDVLVQFSASVRSSGLARLLVDDVEKHQICWIGGGSSATTFVASMQWLATSLAAASHTFKIQWKKGAAGTTHQPGASQKRVLTAVELPHSVA